MNTALLTEIIANLRRHFYRPAQRIIWLLMQPRALFEVALVVGAYLLYFGVRSYVTGQVADAFVNAIRIMHLEYSLGIFREWHIQRLLLPNDLLVSFLNLYYFWGYLPLIAVAAFWFYFRHPEQYRLLRNAFLISGGIGLVIFALFPVAPPRMLPGFTYTLSGAATAYYDDMSWVNLYAAIPSFHVGWNLLLGIGVVWTGLTWHRLLLGAFMPVTMFAATVVTGNHYILDGLVGIAVVLLGLALALALRRYWRSTSLRPALRRIPI